MKRGQDARHCVAGPDIGSDVLTGCARVHAVSHPYIGSPVVREVRHKGTGIMVASQAPPSVPVSLIELSSQILLHKFNSPAWLKHIQKANAAPGGLTPEKMSHLRPGEAYVWSSKATDESFTEGAHEGEAAPPRDTARRGKYE